MSFKKKYPWIQLAGHAGTEPKDVLPKSQMETSPNERKVLGSLLVDLT